jgi:hypothetical protein
MIMRAAVLVDAENVSGKQHVLDVHQFLQTTCVWYQASIQEFAVHGNIQTHQRWKHPDYLISYYQHSGGKNAADEQIHQHALTLTEQGVSLFYLVSNDKYLATVADQLEARGCSVFCLGTSLAARVLRRRADFFRLDERITLVRRGITTTDLLPQGATMTKSYYPSTATSSFEHLTLQERVEQALQMVYQSTILPDVYARFLSLLLELSVQNLCFQEQKGVWIIRNPAEATTLLKDIEQDPLLSLCITAEVRAQWDAISAFAKRCEYAYTCGREEGYRIVDRAPHIAITALLQAQTEKKGGDWEHQLFTELPDEQQRFFRHIDETERPIWLRWYGQGMEQGAREKRGGHLKAWTERPSDAHTNTDRLYN